MIDLSPSREGVLLNVLAQPGARRQGLAGEHGGALRVAVHAPPDKGKANDAILELLAECLSLKPSQVAIIAGATSRRKRVLLRGLTLEEATARVQEAVRASC